MTTELRVRTSLDAVDEFGRSRAYVTTSWTRPTYVTWTLGPEITEPDTEPDDDIEAEVPDVREDTVPDE